MTVVWYELAEPVVNVKMLGAPLNGTDGDDTAFANAAGVASAQVTYISFYENMPNPPTGNVRVPYGTVKLSATVDTDGKHITWLLDTGVKFADDCAGYLPGRIVRPDRTNLRTPHGRLDNATGASVQVGDGFFGHAELEVGDVPAQTSGWVSVSDASVYLDNGIVGFQVDASGVPTIEPNGTATYTATSATFEAVDPNSVFVGMEVRTLHAPAWRSIISAVSSDGTSVTVPAWYRLGDTTKTPGTPANGVGLVINPTDKVWPLNINGFITEDHFTYQVAAAEVGIYNSKVEPANAEDGSGRTWGVDVVNLGPNKGSTGFLSRGSFYEGFRASGADIGYNARAFSGLGYSAPLVGYSYSGGGTSFRQVDASDRVQFSVTGAGIELGTQGAPNTPTIDFHSGATNVDYDSRIVASGGSGSSEGGALTLLAAAVETTHLRPVSDNAVAIGSPTNRWTEVYAVNGTIQTSDPAYKKFLDPEVMAPAICAVRRLKIEPYKWLSAIETKSEEAARKHIGVNAQSVIDAFAAEGIDAHEWGLFCEDEEFEEIEVIDYVEVPDTETVEREVEATNVEGDRVVVRKETRQVTLPKTVKMPMVYEDGTPIMTDDVVRGNDGKFIRAKVPAVVHVPVMRKKEIKRIDRVPTGRKRLALRYDQLILLMFAAIQAATTGQSDS